MDPDERYEAHIQSQLDTVKNKANRETIEVYLAERAANDIKAGTRSADATHLCAWARALGSKKFTQATKADTMRFFTMPGERKANSNSRGPQTPRKTKLSKSTMDHRKIAVRNFQTWVRKENGERPDSWGDDSPPEVAWVKIKREPGTDRFMGKVLSRDDLGKLILTLPRARDKAVVATLYDTGFRASEFLALRVGSVEFDQYGAIIQLPADSVDGLDLRLKTGPRKVRVIHCVPYLQRWLNEHPARDNPEAPLWMSFSPRSYLQGLKDQGLRSLLLDAGVRAKIQHLHPHLFRHSRATEAVKEGMREAEMRIFFGWTSTSPMPGHYIHLGSDDVGDGILRRAGRLDGNNKRVGVIETRPCPTCQQFNGFADLFCARCRAPLTEAAVAQQSARDFAEKLKAHPDILKSIVAEMMEKERQAQKGGSAEA